MEEKLSIRQNLIFNSVGSLFYLVCQWLITVLAVRLGSFTDGGMLNLSITLAGFFFAVATFGMRVFQASDTTGRHKVSCYLTTRMITITGTMLLCLLFVWCNPRYSTAQILCIVLYMVFKMGEALVDTLAAEQQKAWRLDYAGKSLLLRGALSLITFIAGMLVFHSLPAALVLMSLSTISVVLLYDLPVVKRITHVRFGATWQEMCALLRSTWPTMVNCALMTLLAAIPRYYLEAIHGPEMLGIYGSIATPAVIIQAGCSFIYSPLVAPMSEKVHAGDMHGYRKQLLTALAAVIAMLVLMLGGAAVLGEWGLCLLFTESIKPYSYMLIPALIAAFCSAMLYFFEVPLTIFRRLKTMSVIHGCAALIAVVASMFLIPSMGMMGVNIVLYLSAGLDALTMGLVTMMISRRETAAINMD